MFDECISRVIVISPRKKNLTLSSTTISGTNTRHNGRQRRSSTGNLELKFHREMKCVSFSGMSGKRVRDDFEGTEGNGNERNGSIEDGEVMAKPLTEEEELEAKKFAEIAARAEAKAAARAAARLAEKTDSIAMPPPASPAVAPLAAASTSAVASEDSKSVKFLTKKEREELAMQRLQQKHLEKEKLQQQLRIGHDRFITGEAEQEKKRTEYLLREKMEQERIRREKEENKDSTEQNHEIKAIRNQYLGISNKKKRVIKPSEKFTKIFQFDWEETDDTGREDLNPLYNHRVKINPLFGRGYIAGIDLREQRKDSNYLNELMSRRVAEAQREQHGGEDDPNSSYSSSSSYASGGAGVLMKLPIQLEETNDRRLRAELKGKHWSEKSLSEMNERDWRIFREDFDIRIQGGRASLPMRFWNESGLPTEILQAIEAMGYEQPSPIQRQAIPIGMDRKDIIGIAETGSGKTCAFLVPLLNYMLQLPPHQIGRTCDEGPLAIVMAPTRELAQQIQEECIKLAKFTTFQTCSVVGGQSIEEQGFILRRGVEIVIGTPGRLVDCLENNYLVLNQCNYVVLDEADRMIDMGFEPQVIQVLDAMGGLLKSDDETLVEQQV
jgi:ATP-dependent RNA helicase DDX23/PRP28